MSNTDDELDTLGTHLLTEFSRYFPGLTHFFLGCGDDDQLLVQFDLGEGSRDFHQTNADESDADWFIFMDEYAVTLTVPFPVEDHQDPDLGRVHPLDEQV